LLTTRRVSSILTTSKTGNADPKGSGKGDKDLPVDEHDYWSLLKRTMKVVWRHPKWLIATLAASCARGIIAPVWGLLLSMTISAFYEDDPQDIRDTSEMLSFIYIAIGVVVFTSILFQYSGVAQIGERVGMRMRSAMYTAILRREIAFFDQIENDTGEIVTRMADDSRAVSRAFGLSLTMQLKAFFTLIISLALGFAFSWEITLVSLGTFPINIYLFAVMLKGFRANSAPPPDGMSGGGLISSAFINIRTVCAFSMQNQVVSRYHQVIWRDETTPKKLLLYSGVGFGGSKSVSWLTYTLLFWFGTYLIKNDLKSSTLVIRAIFVLMIGLMGIGFSVADIGDQKLGLQAAERIFEVEDAGLNSEINGISTDGLIPTTPSRGKIEFRNVSFRYPTRKHAVVCENFNLTIEPGEVVAFAGPSGSGKSTVMNLLLRFYNPDRGEIFFDGVNIQDLNVNWLRAQIG
jgi:ATP-binding cassette subfamily B (MDR/TAP) protein 1